MGRNLPNVTDAEWAILERLWQNGDSTVRALTDALYAGGGASEYATVHKLLERLEAKQLVKRDRTKSTITFRSRVARDAMIGRQLESVVDKMCGGSLQPLLTNLVRVRRLSAAELRELLEFVEAMDGKSKPKP